MIVGKGQPLVQLAATYMLPWSRCNRKEVVPVGAADANGNYADFTVVTAGANGFGTAGSRDASGVLDLETNATLSAVGGWSFSQTVGTEDVFSIPLPSTLT